MRPQLYLTEPPTIDDKSLQELLRGLPGEPRLSLDRRALRESLGKALPQPVAVAEGRDDALRLLQEKLSAAGAQCYIYKRQSALDDLLEGLRESLAGVRVPQGLLVGLGGLVVLAALAGGVVWLLPKSQGRQLADEAEQQRPAETGLVRLGGPGAGERDGAPQRQAAGPGLQDRLDLRGGGDAAPVERQGTPAGPLGLAFGLGLCSAAAALLLPRRAGRRALIGLPVAAALVLTGWSVVRGELLRRAPRGGFRVVANFVATLPLDGGWFSGEAKPFFGLMEQLRRRQARERGDLGAAADGGEARDGGAEAPAGGPEVEAAADGQRPRLKWRRPVAVPLWPGRAEGALLLAYCCGLGLGTGGTLGLRRLRERAARAPAKEEAT